MLCRETGLSLNSRRNDWLVLERLTATTAQEGPSLPNKAACKVVTTLIVLDLFTYELMNIILPDGLCVSSQFVIFLLCVCVVCA